MMRNMTMMVLKSRYIDVDGAWIALAAAARRSMDKRDGIATRELRATKADAGEAGCIHAIANNGE